MIKSDKKYKSRKLSLTREDIIDYVEKGYLLKDIANEFNVNRCTLSKYIKSLGFPSDYFLNNKNQREKQSKFMKENNPVKGRRPDYILQAMREGYIKAKKEARKSLLETGITYKQYTQYARYDAYVKLIGTYDSSIEEIDHIFSIKDCWDNNIPLELVSHDNNLQILSKSENKKKATNSSITLDEFLNRVGVQGLSKSQTNCKKEE